jgi:hypothetical protein
MHGYWWETLAGRVGQHLFMAAGALVFAWLLLIRQYRPFPRITPRIAKIVGYCFLAGAVWHGAALVILLARSN